MIEFKAKELLPKLCGYPWGTLEDVELRTYDDFEFSYCDYRIGDEVFTKMCPAFLEAFKKEQFWLKLQT